MALSIEDKSPGVVGIVFGAASSVALGAVLALVHLVTQPVEVVSQLPKEPVHGVRYHVKGQGSKGSDDGMDRARAALGAGGGEARFSEADINGWALATFEPTKVTDEERASSMLIVAGAPNFHLVETELQVGMENELIFFGGAAPLVLQARGGFVRAGAGMEFVPREAYLGGLPLHRLPAVLPWVAKRLAPAVPPEVDALLRRATSLTIADGELVLRVQ